MEPNQPDTPAILITDAKTGKECQRLPIDGPYEGDTDLFAKFNRQKRVLTVTVSLSQRTEGKDTDPAAAQVTPLTPRQSTTGDEICHMENDQQAIMKKKRKKRGKKKRNMEGHVHSSPNARTASQGEAADPDVSSFSKAVEEEEEEEEDVLEASKVEEKPVEAKAEVQEQSRSEEREDGLKKKGHTSLGEQLPFSELSGPFIREALAKDRNRDKGEDQWLVKGTNAWRITGPHTPGSAAAASFAAFGVFDGHGGRQVATYASHSILKATMAAVDDAGWDSFCISTDLPEVDGLSDAEVDVWRLQTTLVDRLPKALVKGFQMANEDAHKKFKKGGSTATVAMVIGWELIVANVGDSIAILDTGTEVLQVSGNHRLSDNTAEVERIEASGGEVATSTVDGKPAGPIRVWPGGLAMARSIGDVDAGERVLADPEVKQVTIPLTGGRLFIASDGLWDAVKPKNAAHSTREMGATEAAHKLLAQAIKKDHLKDDVTVIVVDFLPSKDDKVPFSFTNKTVVASPKKGAAQRQTKLAVVRNPLQEPIDHISLGAERRKGVIEDQQHTESERMEAAARLEEHRQHIKAEAKAKQEHGEINSLYAELSNLKLTPEDVEEMIHADSKAVSTTDEKPSKKQQSTRGNYKKKPLRNKGKKTPGRTEKPPDDGQAGETHFTPPPPPPPSSIIPGVAKQGDKEVSGGGPHYIRKRGQSRSFRGRGKKGPHSGISSSVEPFV